MLQPELQAYLSSLPFVPEPAPFVVSNAFALSFLFQLFVQAPRFLGRVFYPEYALVYGASLVPALLLLGQLLQGARRYLAMLALGGCVVLLPLLFHLVAEDTSRFWSYLVLPVLLSLWCVAETCPETRPNAAWRILALLSGVVVVFNAFITSVLMDSCAERFDPLQRAILYLPVFIGVAWHIYDSFAARRQA